MPQTLVADPEAKARARVALGAAELDALFPGWEVHVNVEALDMWDGDWCILGQLGNKDPRLADMEVRERWSTYMNVLKYLHPTWAWELQETVETSAWPRAHGFMAGNTSTSVGYDGCTYEHLLPAWKVLILKRQAEYPLWPVRPTRAPITREEDEAFADEYEGRGIFHGPECD